MCPHGLYTSPYLVGRLRARERGSTEVGSDIHLVQDRPPGQEDCLKLHIIVEWQLVRVDGECETARVLCESAASFTIRCDLSDGFPRD